MQDDPPALGTRVRVRPGHLMAGDSGTVKAVGDCRDRHGNPIGAIVWVAIDRLDDPGWLERTGQRFPLRLPFLPEDLEAVDD